jgi:hypothetical protein
MDKLRLSSSIEDDLCDIVYRPIRNTLWAWTALATCTVWYDRLQRKSTGEEWQSFGKSEVVFCVESCHRGQFWGGGGGLVYRAPRAEQATVSCRNHSKLWPPSPPLLDERSWQPCSGLFYRVKKRRLTRFSRVKRCSVDTVAWCLTEYCLVQDYFTA